jgi:hypothetical protein
LLPQVVSSSFTKSVIRSRAAMTYAEAQSRIDDQRLTDELSVSCLHEGGCLLVYLLLLSFLACCAAYTPRLLPALLKHTPALSPTHRSICAR